MALLRRFVLWVAFGLSACAPARPASEPLGGTAQHDAEAPRRGLDPAKVDAPKLESLFAQRVDEALARPAFHQATDELFASLTGDPALAAQGEALFQALGKDPGLAARAEELQEGWSREPAMVEFVMRLMADNPGASADQIGELAAQQLGRQTASPAFDQAFDFAWDRLIERPKLKAAFDALGDSVGENPQFRRAVSAALHGIDYEPVEKRMIAFNDGNEPDSARATQILSDHAFTTDRLEVLLLTWLKLPEVLSELHQLASDMVLLPSFRKRVVIVSTQLLSDPEIQQGLHDCFLLLLEAHPDPSEMKERFRKTLDTPRVDTILSSFIAESREDPTLQKLGNRFLFRVANSSSFATSIQHFMTDW